MGCWIELYWVSIYFNSFAVTRLSEMSIKGYLSTMKNLTRIFDRGFSIFLTSSDTIFNTFLRNYLTHAIWLNPLSTNLTEWSNTLKQYVISLRETKREGNWRFIDLVGLALKGLRLSTFFPRKVALLERN